MPEPAGRCLGLDVGERRIGVALSDPLGWTAMPMPPVERTGWKKDLARLRELIETFEVRRVVVGLPIRMDGTTGPRAQHSLRFAEKLRAGVKIPVETWDERLTTREAERMLLAADVRREKRREVIDGVAAALLLQAYLNSRRCVEVKP